MRVVFDTNIFLSAVLKSPSVPSAAVHLATRHCTFLKSTATETQLLEVLDRPHLSRLIAPAAKAWLLDIQASAQQITVTERVTACRDPTDDKFLDLAINGNADLIVTGDKDLLVLHPFRTIPILTPAQFLETARP